MLHGLGIVPLLSFCLLFLHSKIHFSTATTNEMNPKMQCRIVGWFVGRLNHIQRFNTEKTGYGIYKKKKKGKKGESTSQPNQTQQQPETFMFIKKTHRTEKYTKRNVKLKSICYT